ncbi:putative phage associated protein [Neisseria gonorrhoeae]|uniref:Putative phage associated protein n=1 Tax=Neisseria gonorrhoeae TaxID=485 RepID=A0A378VUY1_NEIGO|nr:putative phage associated protein [Neisseria gonorrhoeae]
MRRGYRGQQEGGQAGPGRAQALRAAAQAAADGGAEQGGAGFDTAHHDQSHPALRQFADRTKQEEAGRFSAAPPTGIRPARRNWRAGWKTAGCFGYPVGGRGGILDTGVMPDGLVRQYADMAAKYRAKPSEAMGINPDDGAVSAAAALAADSGAAVPSAVSDDVETPPVADDAPSGRSADADRAVFRPLTAMCAPAVRRAVRLRLRRAVLPPPLRAGLRVSRRCLRANTSTAWIRAGARLWRRRRP